MNTRQIYNRFVQLGGWRLFEEYYKMGILQMSIKGIARTIFYRKHPAEEYAKLISFVEQRLRGDYRPFMVRLIAEHEGKESHSKSNTIWTSWWQGEKEAPALVKACWYSQKRYMLKKGWEHVVITSDNYREYIELPAFIEEKVRKGFIPQAQLSDLIRLELLIRYGGIWMDSTVLCTGNNYPEQIETCKLFLFQYRGEQNELRGFSNWFISAESNNRVLIILREMLWQYWRDYDCVVDYYIFHLFFLMIIQALPEILEEMPKGNNYLPLQLGGRLAEQYDEGWWKSLTEKCCFHKLNYRKANKIKNSYYEHIINTYQL